MKLQEGEKIRNIIPLKDFEQEDLFLTIATRNGVVKKTALNAYSNTYCEIICPILPMSTFPLNSNVAVKPLENMIKSSESGNSSRKPGV